MSQNGKGSRQRPRNIDQKTWDKNYNKIFNRKKSKHKKTNSKT